MSDRRSADGQASPPDSGVIEAIYGAAIDARNWPDVLARMATLLGAGCGVLAQIRQGRHVRPRILAAYGTQPACLARLVARYRGSPLAERVARAPEGVAVAETRQAHAAFRRSKTYAEVWAPAQLGLTLLCRLQSLADGLPVIGFARATGQPPFDAASISLLGEWLPHLRMALMLRDLSRQVSSDRAGLALALDHFNLAALLLDQDARVLARNRRADDLLADMGALRLDGGRLVVRRRDDAAALRAAVEQAAVAARNGHEIAPPLLHMRNRSGVVLQSILLLPAVPAPMAAAGMSPVGTLPVGLPMAAGEAVVLAFVSFGCPAPLSLSLVMREFGLTMAEARVAAELAAGQTPTSIAARFGLAEATVRVQIKNALAKSNTHSQAQLIGRLLQGLPQLRHLPVRETS